MTTIPWLNPYNLQFPPAENALKEPNGLLAIGGDLSPERILAAYHHGIFPWFNPGDPILWWSPSPRTVIYPDQLHISKSLSKILRKGIYRVTFDNCFEDVMRACAEPRTYANETWISEDIIKGYTTLHNRGYAHSVEVWQENQLVGGLYGMALGKVFFGESMFSRVDNASKFGFAHLVRQLRIWNFQLIDCQVANNHLFSLGAMEIPREEFQKMLVNFIHEPSVYSRPWSTLTVGVWE
ncbi:MAG TPA: leucyl/phenylalanyl-tRNA--protein transferase [Cellvibrio sp.]|nr:leucyl/phenylalanyl-tRNA--protein transferase [Cellvibrio sp.]